MKRKEYEEELLNEKNKLYHQAMYDYLTGLPNRRNAEETGNEMIGDVLKREGEMALFYMNIRNFKSLNSTYGRLKGDLILRMVAKRLVVNTEVPVSLARLESDEFLILVPDLDKKSLEAFGVKLKHIMEKPYLLDSVRLSLNFKMGISMAPYDGINFNVLLKNAAIAAQNSKKYDSDSMFFKKPQIKRISERMFLEQELRTAVRENKGIELFFQPCIKADTGKINHLEALMRWRKDSAEMVSPGKFIPVAEETGLIHDLGDLALQKSCYQLNVWREKGILKPVSYNVSAMELNRDDFIDRLRDVVESYHLERHMMGIEITESALIEDMQKILEKLKRIKELGLTISVDDFGTGYSSLSYINRFPLDYIKIDKSFIDELNTERSDPNPIVSTIINLSRMLGVTNIAEGVETVEQLNTLKKLGCPIIQGYYFYRPMPAEQVTKILMKEGKE